MLRLAETRERVGVVADQIGNPTSALDIADGLLTVAENLLASNDPALRGTFHMTGGGTASWAEFAGEIFRLASELGAKAAAVDPIPTSAYPTPARRPQNSRLAGDRLAAVHGVHLPDWHGSLETVVRRLMAGCTII